MSKIVYLALFDTPAIKEYVFATSKLKEIHGASLLLGDFNELTPLYLLTGQSGAATKFGVGNYFCRNKQFELSEKSILSGKIDWQVIYLGGGAGKILFEKRGPALKFCLDLKREAEAHLVSAKVVTHVESWNHENESFGEVLERGERHLRLVKSMKITSNPLFNGLYLCPCNLCGQLPGRHPDPRGVEAEVQVCESCLRKWRCAAGEKPLPFQHYSNKRRQELTAVLQEVAGGQGNVGRSLSLPGQLSEIGDRGRPENYVAMLYTDINGLGKALSSLLQNIAAGPELYSELSDAIDAATKEALAESLKRAGPTPEQEDEVFPVEVIVGGGDDLIIIVPAQFGPGMALAFTKAFAEIFKTKSKDKAGLQELDLSVSAGLLITKSSYPIRNMVDLSFELLKSAKKAFRHEGCAAIDFAAIKSAAVQSVAHHRKHELTRRLEAGQTCKIYARPYKREQFEALLHHIQAFQRAGFPRNKLKAFYSTLFTSEMRSQLEAYKLVTRLPQTSEFGDESPRQAFLDFWQEQDLDRFPWRHVDEGLDTPLPDLIELYEFIEPRSVQNEESHAGTETIAN